MTYINPRGKVLKNLDRVLAWQRGEKPGPLSVEWDLSNRCSLGCQDCHFAHTHSKGPWVTKGRALPMAYDGTGDLADRALVWRALDELKATGVKAIVWSGGGEPTLHPHVMDIVQRAHELGFQQGMYTLGGHLTAEGAQVLAKAASFVVVSLDAPDPYAYAKEKGVPESRFDAACQGIKWLSAAKGAAIGVSFLLHEANWMRAYSMLGMARELGATYATFRPAIQFDRQHQNRPEGSRSWVTSALVTLRSLATQPDVELDPERFVEYRDWQGHGYATCYGVRLNATITPDGRVWVCPNRRGMPGSSLGDLRTESFGSIWARHPAHFAVNDQCRVMCRLHAVNQTLDAIESPTEHEAFV
jgi:MoaA/NifB/PqqE/SkfB family radical SAM enzyme